jgi:flagellar protein FlbD
MIHLTRLNNKPLVVNADLIKFIEQSPDTVISLTTGEKLVVRESVEEVLLRVADFRRLCQHSVYLPDGPPAPSTPGPASPKLQKPTGSDS